MYSNEKSEKVEEIEEAGLAAKLVMMNAITERVPNAGCADMVQLAEAFAWLVSPAQPHGGAKASK